MILYLILCAICSVAALFVESTLDGVLAILMIAVGTLLCVSFRTHIHAEYLHLRGIDKTLALLPPLSIAMILNGLVQSWMMRVGIGRLMRLIAIPLLLVGLTFGFTSDPATAVLVFLLACASSILRELKKPNLYLLPIVLASMYKMVSSW